MPTSTRSFTHLLSAEAGVSSDLPPVLTNGTGNNIANASTPGFKRHVAVQEGFYQTFELALAHTPARFNALRAPGGGVRAI
ncbi:MAG: hypothetical protein HC844_16830 [Tabrizicola sp.]|nr:hypothetical protein [Tabrizicola sp.]